MKRKIAGILAGIFLFSSCGESKNPSNPVISSSTTTVSGSAQENLDSIERQLLSDWSAYITTCENICKDMIWVIDYCEKFLQEPNWDNLQKARMSLAAAIKYIQAYKIPELTLSQENYDILIQNGKDITFVQPEMDSFEIHKESTISHYRVLTADLYVFVFWKRERDIVVSQLEVLKKLSENDIHILACYTKELLFLTDSEETISDFNQFLMLHCLHIYKFLDAPAAERQNEDEELEKVIKLIKEREALVSEYSKILGEAQASLNLYKDSVEADEIQKNIAQIEGELPVIPLPDFYSPQTMEGCYYWNRDENNIQNGIAAGEHIYPRVRQVLEKPADGGILIFSNVSREEFLEYLFFLESNGIPGNVKGNIESDKSIFSLFTFENSSFAVSWEDNTAQLFLIKAPLGIVPSSYFIALG